MSARRWSERVMMRYWRELVLGVVLLCLTLGVFWHARNNRFVSFDDHTYVVENPHVLGGLTWENLRWDFSDEDFRASNWHPLTWLSLQLDTQLCGANPKYLHQTNVLFHAANGVLLFVFFRVLTGTVWRGAAVAALFALHPLRVESVAWVAERKDVLSVFFG